MTWVATKPVHKISGIGQGGDPLHDQTLRLFGSVETELRIEIERIFGRAVTDANMAAIVAAFETGSIARVEAAINFATVGAALGTAMGPILQQAMIRGAEQALAQFPGQITAGFNVTDPLAVGFIRDHGAMVVREITAETEAALRLIIERAYTRGLGSRAAARDIRSVIGLTRRQALTVSNFRTALIEAIETDAGPGALVEQFRLSRNVVNTRNLRLANVDSLTRSYQNRWIEHRAGVIARHESVMAVSAGRRALWEQAAASGALNKETDVQVWFVTPDESSCPICVPMHGQEAPIGGEFRTGDGRLVKQPGQTHIGCRCDVRIETKGQRGGDKSRARQRADDRIEELQREQEVAARERQRRKQGIG